MAHKTEKQRILSGSLNLLPPSDKIPDGDAILLDNWRVDQQGKLQSRNGCTREASQIGSGTFHTLTRSGNDRYSGVGTDLFWGPSLQTLLAGGFDGNPLGISFYQGAAWVMNRNKQLRLLPGGQTNNIFRWGVDAPPNPPTVTAGAYLFKTVEEYEASSKPDVGYFDAQGNWQDQPKVTTVLASVGTVQVVTGSSVVVGTLTKWDTTMVGATILITTTFLGQKVTFSNTVLSVQDNTHLTMTSPFATFDENYGLAYQIVNSQAAMSFDTGNFKGGAASLKVNASTPATGARWVITDNLPSEGGGAVDTRTLGVAQDEDEFRIWFYCSDPKNVTAVTLALFSNYNPTGPLAGVYGSNSAWVTIPGSFLNQQPNSWTQLKVRRNIDADALRALYTGLGQQPNPFTDASGNPTSFSLPGAPAPDPSVAAAYAAFQQAAADVAIQINAIVSKPFFTVTFGGQILTGITQNTSGNTLITAQFGTQITQPNFAPSGFFPDAVDWSAITAIQVLVDTIGPCQFNLDHAEFAGSAGVALTGNGAYFVSFANVAGEDGNLSPEADVTLANQSAILTAIPISTDPQVTQRWIWRVGFGSSQILLVGTIPDNSTTMFVDTKSVTDAQNDGIVASFNRTLPPAARGLIGPYFGKLIAFNTDKNPARYFWTPSGQPWFFPGADDGNIGNWEDAGGDDDPIIACTNHASVLMFYKARSIWRLQGDPQSEDPQQITGNVGLVGPKAVCNGGSLDYFVGPEGIYEHNIYGETKISEQLDPIFKGDYTMVTNGEYLPPIDPQGIANSVLALINDRLRFCYAEIGHQMPNVVAIYHTGTKRWAREKYSVAGVAPTTLNYEGSGNFMMAGFTSNIGAFLYSLENQQADNQTTIHVAWQSRFSDQGLPDNFKRYGDIGIDFQTATGAQTPSTLTAYLVLDNGNKILLGTFSSLNRTTVQFLKTTADPQEGGASYFGERGKNAALRIEGDILSTCVIYGTYLHWYPEERQAVSFDSGFMSKERVSQVDYVDAQVTGQGQVIDYILSTDQPGSVMRENVSSAFFAPQGRGNPRFRLGSGGGGPPVIVEGRDIRINLGGTTVPFQVHALRLRYREIGEYIDGTLPTPEYWESPEFSVAPGRAGELKDLLLDYDTVNLATGTAYPGNASLVLYADLPGNALVPVRTIALPGGTRRTFTFPFEGGADQLNDLPLGTLFKVRLYPPTGGILRLHDRGVIRARLIGVYFDGSAGEIWDTQPISLVDGIGEFREVHMVAETAGPMLFEVQTSLPGENIQTRSTYTLNTTIKTTGREPVRFRVPGNTKGWLQRFRISGPYVCRIFDVQVYGRRVGGGATPWQWLKVPMEHTADEWAPITLPMHKTAEEFSWADLPVDAIE